jgi:AcrR family transcriptional regulator
MARLPAVPRPRFAKLAPEKQRAILDAAMEEFASSGYERASYNRIIERAGVSKGAMYYYFDDKEDLFTTVVQQVMELAIGQFAEFPAFDDADQFWDATREFIVSGWAFMKKNPVAVGVMKSALSLQASGATIGAVRELQRLYQEWAEGFLRQGQAVGAVRSDLPFGLLMAVVIAVASAGDMWLSEHFDEVSGTDPDQFSRQFTEMFRGALAPP